jgi:glycosyltransferase involved in cell wall biosynthesis
MQNNPPLTDARIAVAHEWVASRAGSEKVFERMAVALPSAELFALTFEPGVRIETSGRPVSTTYLDTPFFRNQRAASLPLMPHAWRRLARQRNFDLVVTSSHAFAREFARSSPKAAHLCYVHSPMRYAWERNIDPRTQSPLTAPPAAGLRFWDRSSVNGVTSFAANSLETQDRIRRHYKRDSVIIHPPVDTGFFRAAVREPNDYLLAFGRFIEYKRFDLAIDVANELGKRLIIAGSGPLEEKLRSHAEGASVPVEFMIQPSDEELLTILGGAQVLLFPGVEDFGIVPVEAQAAGVPVVGPALGGLRDTVHHGVTGILTSDQTVGSLANGVRDAINADLGGEPCRAWTDQFRAERFDEELLSWIESATSP